MKPKQFKFLGTTFSFDGCNIYPLNLITPDWVWKRACNLHDLDWKGYHMNPERLFKAKDTTRTWHKFFASNFRFLYNMVDMTQKWRVKHKYFWWITPYCQVFLHVMALVYFGAVMTVGLLPYWSPQIRKLFKWLFNIK